MAERRTQLLELAERARRRARRAPAPTPGARGRSSGSSTRRTTAGTTRSSATSSGETTRFGLHVHVGIRGADRAIRVTNALRSYLPDLLALSASSPFVEEVFTYLHSARTQIFTKHVPALRRARRVRRLGRVRALRPLPVRHRLDHRAHAALVERSPAPRLPDRRDPDLRRPAVSWRRRSRSRRSSTR